MISYSNIFNETFILTVDVETFDVDESSLIERLDSVERLVRDELVREHGALLCAYAAALAYERQAPRALDSALDMLEAIHAAANEIADRECAIAFGEEVYVNKVSIGLKERI